MKMQNIKRLIPMGTIGTICALIAGCSAETPFDTDSEGILRLQMSINSKITRTSDYEQYLADNCVIYISDKEGLLHKFIGVHNVPSEIHLKSGQYFAEAWSGDSIGASYDKKFFRGYEKFDITAGEKSVNVICKIQNVVMSVNSSSIDPELMKDWKVTFSHSRAALDITEETQSERVYMMLPNADKDILYTVTGTTADGQSFTKQGTLKNVERAHEYIFNFTFLPDNTAQGGAFINIVIEDEPISDDTNVPLYGKPSIAGEEFDIDNQLYGEPGAFEQDAIVKVSAFGGIDQLFLESTDWQILGLPAAKVDLLHLTPNLVSDLNAKGINWLSEHNEEKNLTLEYINFSSIWLNSIPQRDKEYVIAIEAYDIYGKSNEVPLRIAVGEDALEVKAPATPDPIDPTDYMAVLSKEATVSVTVNNPEAPGLTLQYREAGSGNWLNADLKTTRAKTTMYAKLTGLKPSTRYEYRTVAEGFESPSQYLTTESIFVIPNSSMEEWSNYTENNKVIMPSGDGTKSFWDTGNHGSATMSVNLTQSSDNPFHTGSKSAQLRSQFVGVGGFAGKFAAGNLFAGEYLRTDGTDGVLQFGRPYDGSHPTALSVWMNYRPAEAIKSGAGSHVAQGSTDQGQIYVAISTEPVEVRTKTSDQKLFNKDDSCILAYGELTFTENVAADGQMEKVSIPITYNAKAKNNKPLYLIIVCTASKFGDYFEGGEGSTMYLDDFELVY